MALLQGFEEINMSVPTGKSIMTVTDSVVRFNNQDSHQRQDQAGCAASLHREERQRREVQQAGR